MRRTVCARLVVVASTWAALGCSAANRDASSAGGDGGAGTLSDARGAPGPGDARNGGDDGSPVSDDAAPTPPDAGALEYDAVAPTPSADWVSVTNNLTGLSSECGNMGGVYPDPRTDRLIAGVALQGLWASTDGAQTWTAIGTGGNSIKNRTSTIVWDPARATTFWQSGIYGWETGTDGAFITTDDGNSFQGYAGLSSAQMGGNTNDSISIDFGDPQRQTLLAGTHEQTQTLYLSTDAGASWSNIGPSLPAGLGFCTSTLVLDSTTFLVGCAASWSGFPGAILRSNDRGGSWTQVHGAGVVGQPLWASDGTIYWSEEGGGMFKSSDEGATWSPIADASTAGTVSPIELPDGRIASAQHDSVVITADKGGTWTAIGTAMPYVPVGLSYSPFRSAFYIWYFTCTGTNAVPGDAISRFGWDYR
jgi:hypothetical protein